MSQFWLKADVLLSKSVPSCPEYANRMVSVITSLILAMSDDVALSVGGQFGLLQPIGGFAKSTTTTARIYSGTV